MNRRYSEGTTNSGTIETAMELALERWLAADGSCPDLLAVSMAAGLAAAWLGIMTGRAV
jgi:hypothetical protein